MAICFLSSHRRRFSISVISIIPFPWLEWLSPNCFRWSIEALDKWSSNGNFYEFFHKLTEAWELWILHSTGCSFNAGWIIAHIKKGELISLNYVLAPFWSSLCSGFIMVMWSLIFICKSRRAEVKFPRLCHPSGVQNLLVYRKITCNVLDKTS